MDNNVVIITGAGNGIGKATAIKFAKANAKVVIADINDFDGNKTSELIHSYSKNSTFVSTDISIEKDVINLVDTTIKLYGKINIVINNAAAFVFCSIENTNKQLWENVINTNVIGYSNLIKYSLPHLKKEKYSNIVNVGSVSSFIAQPNFLPYNTSKGAVRQLTKCLALDLGKYSIRVNSVSPGPIFTNEIEKQINKSTNTKEEVFKIMSDKTVLKRVGQPEDVANAIYFLASNKASFITGANLVIDGGSTIN